ncbi:hypothetical protein CSC67_10540 [Pusillimonas caeni]|uniref:Rap1a/Tai family immunity protein n=1 Tax=Pusillimonas caeni TaxID=1348472 RepID=UPI001074FAB9|nr:Rap1a/Tai family immunity protein [Pusillimonas caeni]TFL13689.1 hypothetical protein CSC67_10540 [Pusillimonas caeni]
MRLPLFLAAALFASPAASQSDESMVSLVSGNHVYQLCEPKASAVRKNSCSWYVKGIIEGVQVHAQPSQLGYSLLCMPDDLPGAQLTGVFGKYLEDHPEQRHEPALALVVRAMTAAFPCP